MMPCSTQGTARKYTRPQGKGRPLRWDSSDGEDPHAANNDEQAGKHTSRRKRRTRPTPVELGSDDNDWVCAPRNEASAVAACASSSQSGPVQEEVPSGDLPYKNLMSVPGFDKDELLCTSAVEGVSCRELAVTSAEADAEADAEAGTKTDAKAGAEADAQAGTKAEADADVDAEAGGEGGASGATGGSLRHVATSLNLCPECEKMVASNMLRGKNKDGLYLHHKCMLKYKKRSICKTCKGHRTHAQKHGTSTLQEQTRLASADSCKCGK